MNTADLPRFYRAALTYHPEIGTFRGGRGAWRVAVCIERVRKIPGSRHPSPPDVRVWADGIKRLHMDVPRLLRRNTFVNPTLLLKILLEQRREAALLATAARVWEGPRGHA